MAPASDPFMVPVPSPANSQARCSQRFVAIVACPHSRDQWATTSNNPMPILLVGAPDIVLARRPGCGDSIFASESGSGLCPLAAEDQVPNTESGRHPAQSGHDHSQRYQAPQDFPPHVWGGGRRDRECEDHGEDYCAQNGVIPPLREGLPGRRLLWNRRHAEKSSFTNDASDARPQTGGLVSLSDMRGAGGNRTRE